MSAKKKAQSVVITVEAQIYPKDTLFLRNSVGEAKRDGQEWELTTHIGSGAPLIRLPDGQWVIFGWAELIDAANQAATQQEGRR